MTTLTETLRLSVQVRWLHDHEVSDTLLKLKDVTCDHTNCNTVSVRARVLAA